MSGQRAALGQFHQIGRVFGIEFAIEHGKARGQRGNGVVAAVAGGDLFQQFVERIVRSRSSGAEIIFGLSVTPTASIKTKRVLASASGVTARRSVLLIERTPRPFICSK